MMDNPDNADNDTSDHEINESQHSSLLAAVSQLDVKQRVKPPSRKESSHQISEFHLVKKGSDKNVIKISNLTKVLGQRGSHAVIGKQLRSLHQRAKTLPRPLEKPVAAKTMDEHRNNPREDNIKMDLREVGYDGKDWINLAQNRDQWRAYIQRSVAFKNVKADLGRWNAVVYSNRAADQLSFPLKQGTINFETTSDCVVRWKSQKRTPLEAQMDEILNSSPAAQEDRKKDEEFLLNLEEMRERRREMAKLRAQQSYMASKASRQNKIKSKKYHRILRRERIKQQLKDFEMLQKTDPEAALKQLEQLERTRAEERVSLRHRSTGQWARNKAVRAKYDKESRQELAQQLAVSRDLTQKVQTANSSDDEDDEEPNEKVMQSNNDNPWIAPKMTSEVEEFVTSYRKFWEEQNSKSSKEIINAKSTVNNDERNEMEEKVSANGDSVNGVEKEIVESDFEEVVNESNVGDSDNKEYVSNSLRKRKRHKSGTNNTEPLKSEEKWFSELKEISHIKDSNSHKPKHTESSVSVIATSNSWIVTPIKENPKKSEGAKKRKNDKICKTSGTKEFEVNELFDDMEEKLKEKVGRKLKKLRSDLKIKDTKNVDYIDSESDHEGPSLEMKQVNVRPDLDEELIEQPYRGLENNAPSENDINLNMKIAQARSTGQEEQISSTNIDPNKFIEVKTTHLQTELPNIITEGDEAIDDSDEDGREERQMTISEAFAEDDVIAEFRKEKEEIEEKSQPQNVDLSLPGWGEWGGKNLQVSKRKKRRFIIKFPKVAPRKDANKGSVIINEEKNDKVKVHQVNELPFPFTSVKDFEASIRAPIGNTWIPETAHRRLTKPSVVTKLGSVIQPMDEESLVNKKKIKEIK
ncbi:hypothetical protein ANN_14593 [Periplaneta americana]|uniref:Uncharacterized protein n=1 Tax=Periplaneta americana TaxID=6978 RepID=A0ABQ8SY38_PERAM|nr:hypothetical protein ANN_14593 [Periplaneta americana]